MSSSAAPDPGSEAAPPRVRATLLGTGTSTGVPIIGCTCAVCRSDDPRDHRTRCACYVEADTPSGPVRFVIDVGPDFRAQALRENIPAVDAVLVTHHHFDHVVGMDDLRPFFFGNRAAIPVWAAPDTADVLKRMFAYIFEDGSYPGVSNLDLKPVGAGAFSVRSREHGGAVRVEPLQAMHGRLPVLGFRIGGFAYLTDVSDVPEATRRQLQDLDVLILDGLRPDPHPSHLSIPEAVEVAQQIGARATYLTHLTHAVRHAETDAALPDGVHLAYDGLRVEAEI